VHYNIKKAKSLGSLEVLLMIMLILSEDSIVAITYSALV
jgi:hypothetical protein